MTRQATAPPRIVPAIPLALSRTSQPKRDGAPDNSEHPSVENGIGEHTGSSTSSETLDDSTTSATQASPTFDTKISAFVDGSTQNGEQPNGGERQDHGADVVGAPVEESATSVLQPQLQPRPEQPDLKQLKGMEPDASRPAPPPVPLHHPRPVANGIIFGGLHDSSNNSPAPPVSGSMLPYPPPLPPFMNPNFAPPPFIPPGQAHNPSEHAMYASLAVPPPGVFAHRRDHPIQPHFARSQHWHPNDPHIPYRMAPLELFPTHRGPLLHNGVPYASRSPSQTSTTTQDLDAPLRQETAEYHSRESTHGAYNHSLAPDGVHAQIPAQSTLSYMPEDSAFSLRDYLSSQFGNPDFADYILELSRPGLDGPLTVLPIHGLIVSRSPRLATLMAQHTTGSAPAAEKGPKLLRILLTDKFLSGNAFVEALKYLYGAPLLSLQDLSHGLRRFNSDSYAPEDISLAQHRMEAALGYVAAGQFLGVTQVALRGLDLAKGLLRWDNLEPALSFGLDGGLGSFWQTDEPRDGPFSSASSDASSPRVDSMQRPPTYGIYSPRLLQAIIEFVVINVPKDFALDDMASQLLTIPRLPHIVEVKPPFHNPRLSQIRFGDIPIEEPIRPKFVTTLLSSILLSIPFGILKSLLEHPALGDRIGLERIAEFVHSVVRERENRRRKVLKHRSIGARNEAQWQATRWEERVEPDGQHRSGYRISRLFRADAPYPPPEPIQV